MSTTEMGMAAESTAAVVTWVLDTLATPFVEKVKNVAYDKLEERRWKKATEEYLNGILRDYGTVRVLGHADMPLKNIFTDVYILGKLTAEHRYGIENLQKEGEALFRMMDEPKPNFLKPHKGIGLVRQHRNLYILGKPGAGKTTFMKYVVTQVAQQNFFKRLPIFVSLHEWANSGENDLFSFIVQEFDTCGFPHAQDFVIYLLGEGKGLLLFDGLDEVRKEGKQREQMTRRLRNFIRKYHKNQYLITCRVAADEYRFAGFRNVEVADFTRNQIHDYVKLRFQDTPPKYEAFIKAIAEDQHKAVQELCKTPLLLSLVCLYFEENMDFPQRRSELYADALDVLLRKWDKQRNKQRDVIFYGKLSPQRKQQMLARIATPAFEAGHYFLKKEDLSRQIADYLSKLPGIQLAAEDINGEEVLQEIAAQHGLLVERSTNIYSFSHLTFQEYFTARYIVENEARGRTQALITKHLIDKRWREVFFLVASMLEDGDDFCHLMRTEIDTILNRRARLKEMVIWSQARTQAANPAGSRQATVRFAYVTLARSLANSPDIPLDFPRTLAFDIARTLDFSLDFNFDLTLDIALSIQLALALTIDLVNVLGRVLTLARARDLTFDLALDLDLDRAKNINIYLGVDYGLYFTWAISTIFARRKDKKYQDAKDTYARNFPQLFELCEIAACHELLTALKAISIPRAGLSSSPASWQKVADALAELMRTHRDLRTDWPIDSEDVEALRNYFNANELLVRCLDLAFVTDRQGFKNGLLLPPK